MKRLDMIVDRIERLLQYDDLNLVEQGQLNQAIHQYSVLTGGCYFTKTYLSGIGRSELTGQVEDEYLIRRVVE